MRFWVALNMDNLLLKKMYLYLYVDMYIIESGCTSGTLNSSAPVLGMWKNGLARKILPLK